MNPPKKERNQRIYREYKKGKKSLRQIGEEQDPKLSRKTVFQIVDRLRKAEDGARL